MQHTNTLTIKYCNVSKKSIKNVKLSQYSIEIDLPLPYSL